MDERPSPDRSGRRRQGSRGRPRSFGAALVLAGLSVLSIAGTAMAKPYERSSFSDSGTDPEYCGGFVSEWSYSARWRTDEATAASNYQFFDYTQSSTYSAVITNPANGKSFSERLSSVHTERHPVVLPEYDGVVVRFDVTERGRYTVRDERGKVVFRDHGVVEATLVFDTYDDGVPGGEVIGEPDILRDTWRHPDFDICPLADRLIG